VYFGNTGAAGTPAFAAPQTNPFGLADIGSHAMPEFADLDADGDLDLVMGRSDGNLLVFLNTGTTAAPAFAAPVTNPFGLVDVDAIEPDPADLDGDGDVDLLVGGVAGLVFFENTGTSAAPAFAAPVANPFGLVDGGSVPAPDAADLDGDGDLDVLVGDYTGRISWFENVAIDPDACSDGLDNDGDGRVDFGSDPGCASAADPSELSAKQCDNGLDDDADGFVDAADPHCTGPLDDREAPTQPSPGCGLGPELLLLGPLLAAVRRRRGSYTARTCPSASPTPRPISSSSGAR
jgi:hypothetical protein